MLGPLSAGLLAAHFALKKCKETLCWSAAIIFLTLATLGKGPVGIIIPAFVLTAWIISESRDRAADLIKIISALTFVFLLALVWYYAAYRQAADEFFGNFWYENVQRFAGTMRDQPHSHSFIYLFGMLLLGTLPWSPICIWLFYKAIRAKKIPNSFSTLSKSWKSSDPIIRFSILVVVVVFAFYSIPSSKRSVYLLAAYPFLAILEAYFLQSFISGKLLRNVFVVASLVSIFFQTLLEPLFISPRTSERVLAKKVAELSDGQSKIFSFGFEFYGASFYSGKTFFRLEDSFPSQKRALLAPVRNNDLVVSFDSDLDQLKTQLTPFNLISESVGHSEIGKKGVSIASLSYLNVKE